MKATSEVDYPAYGVTGPALPPNGKDSRGSGLTGDRKLAQSAQMYHYQHQKQQMIASERYVSASRRRECHNNDLFFDCTQLLPTEQDIYLSPTNRDRTRVLLYCGRITHN